MKTAVIYASKTGHSKQLANAIAQELKVSALNITTNPKLENIDLLFIVGGIYGNKSLPELTEYLKALDNNNVTKVALITSCVSNKMKQEEVRKLLKEKNINVLEDEFICQGSFLLFGLKHPNKADVENAVSFAKKIYNTITI
jgi:flavodoxin